MIASHRIKALAHIGSFLWAISAQYFVVQLVVSLDFAKHYSWRFNTISDLGNTACSNYGSRFVCSPQHVLMNISFILLGTTMISGSLLIYRGIKQGYGSLAGFTAMAMSGLGTILVGLFPENTVSWLHITGAALAFLVGNIGVIILGLTVNLPRLLKVYSLLSGIVALIALAAFITSHYFGLGIGGMERVVAYPQTLWLIVIGFYLLMQRPRQ